MKVAGLNVMHDGGCCLLIDGRVACAISEERLTRKKGARGWLYSLEYCLKATQTALREIDAVIFSSYGDPLPSRYDGGLSSFGFDHTKCHNLDHHLSHAYSAFMLSPFEEALIVVIDGSGNRGDTESYYVGRGNEIEKIGDNHIKETYRGIGKTYEAFTNFLGWKMVDSGKTMGLASYGDPDAFNSVTLFDMGGDQVNSRLKKKYAQGVIEFAEETGLDFGPPFDRGRNQRSRDVAYLIQAELERIVVSLVDFLVRKTGLRNLCLAGGVALNSVANQKILNETPVNNLFIPPPASDKGQGLGNALYGYHNIFGRPRQSILNHDYFGRRYADDEIELVLTKRPELGGNFLVGSPEFDYEHLSDVVPATAKLLADGNIIGWFQGGCELGPRALGNRSILADPRRKEIKDRLDAKVKFREAFRPYAPSVLSEHSGDFFEIGHPSPFMLLVAKVKESKRKLIPAVVHVDGTARLHTVSKDGNNLFYRLLHEFNKITGVPILLNTSFNRAGEPIVETPRDAMEAFLMTEMDYLVMGNFLVRKKGPRGS